MSRGWAVSTLAYRQRRAVGMIWPPPRWIASACSVTSWTSKRTPRMFSSHSAPCTGSGPKPPSSSCPYCSPPRGATHQSYSPAYSNHQISAHRDLTCCLAQCSQGTSPRRANHWPHFTNTEMKTGDPEDPPTSLHSVAQACARTPLMNTEAKDLSFGQPSDPSPPLWPTGSQPLHCP